MLEEGGIVVLVLDLAPKGVGKGKVEVETVSLLVKVVSCRVFED